MKNIMTVVVFVFFFYWSINGKEIIKTELLVPIV
jgi:hypothetical protein